MDEWIEAPRRTLLPLWAGGLQDGHVTACELRLRDVVGLGTLVYGKRGAKRGGYAGWRCQPSPTIIERVMATDAWAAEFQPLRIRPTVVDTSFLMADVLTTRPRSQAEWREAIPALLAEDE